MEEKASWLRELCWLVLARAAKQAKYDNTSGHGDDPGSSQPLSAQYQEGRVDAQLQGSSENECERCSARSWFNSWI